MSLEIEQAYGVDPAKVPDLTRVPCKSIEQVYLSPYPPKPRYPEVADGEWRVRKIIKPGQEPHFTTAVKFGDKTSGSRLELETALEPGDFGTDDAATMDYGFGLVRKRRYQLPDQVVVDQFDKDTHGDLWLAEREFASPEEAAGWQPPEWCRPLPRALSNRELARPLQPAEISKPTKTIDEVHGELEALRADGEKILVTISGMSGSGKSTVARALAERLKANHLETDRFHLGRTILLERYGDVNHDLPKAYDYARAAVVAARLLIGQTVDVPVYDFVTAEPLKHTETVEPTSEGIVVLEGLYAALASDYAPALESTSIKTYNILMATPLYVCVLRRLIRDAVGAAEPESLERQVSMTPEETLRYLMAVAIPTYRRYARSTNRFDAVVT